MSSLFSVSRNFCIGMSTNDFSFILYNKTKDGKQTGMIIFNELHAYEDYKQLNVFRSGLGKIIHARKVTITTNGTVREGPLDEKIYSFCIKLYSI